MEKKNGKKTMMTVGERFEDRLRKLESKVHALELFRQAVLSVVPPEQIGDYTGFTLDQLVSLASEKGPELKFECDYRCNECLLSTRVACWEALNEKAESEKADNNN